MLAFSPNDVAHDVHAPVVDAHAVQFESLVAQHVAPRHDPDAQSLPLPHACPPLSRHVEVLDKELPVAQLMHAPLDDEHAVQFATELDAQQYDPRHAPDTQLLELPHP